ncbi:acyl-homoserine lactone synthase [Devosia sp. UYZn731]|uniref:acyl-homoserine-lactone synthase n=1 Tax=Devosia sp. UYZn731 TaxID=3156345 RepID=UPI00339A729E
MSITQPLAGSAREPSLQALVVDHTNAARHSQQLDHFHYQRHRVYAEELGWVPATQSRREFDAFDTEDAVYILVLDHGEFVAGSRLIPTDKPHLASTVFPDTFTLAPIIRSAEVLEWTRGFIIPERRSRGSVRLLAASCAAVMEYCLRHGHRQVGGMQDKKWLPLWAKLGWRVHIHGEPRMIEGQPWLPAYFDVTEGALDNANILAGLDASILLDDRPL